MSGKEGAGKRRATKPTRERRIAPRVTRVATSEDGLELQLAPADAAPHVAPGSKGTRPNRAALVLLALGITLATVAWGTLVLTAIDFGRSAQDGDHAEWFYMGLATAGAVAAILLGIVLVVRLMDLLRGPVPPSDVPARGGKRARR